MNSINKISPLLSPGYWIPGVICLISGLAVLILNITDKKPDIDIAFILFCFGLFCIGYRKEKNETDKDSEIVLRRYHSLRLALSLTTVLVVVISTQLIFSNDALQFNALHSLFIYLLLFNCINFTIKIFQKRKSK